jgi:hypothetical protein
MVLIPIVVMAQRSSPGSPLDNLLEPCGVNMQTGAMIMRTMEQCQAYLDLPPKYGICNTVDMPLQECINNVNGNIAAEERRTAVRNCINFNQNNWVKVYGPPGPGVPIYEPWAATNQYWCEQDPSYNQLGN